MQLKVLCLTLLVCISLFLPAQTGSYPKDYFRNPLGISMDLTANFGELRSDHWHMGLDIRTGARENLPVYAAADGYIAHIGIRSQSFGRFIIIRHPNGLSTLYAHLNDFFPELEKYVTEQQYKKESWAIELDLTKSQFPVAKGSFIAYSGNTGGSMGPHLHFEIIDTKTDKRLNPLLFNFPITDNLRPTLLKLAVYDRSRSVFDQTPKFYSLRNTSSEYILSGISVFKTGLNRLSFALQAYDKMSSRSSPNGIYSAKLFLDDAEQVRFVLDSIDYDETVYLNAQIDYKYKYNGGSYLQHIAQLPGDHGAAYKKIMTDGVITLSDTVEHTVIIEVSDANKNVSQLKFKIQFDDSLVKDYEFENDMERFPPGKVNVIEKPGFECYLPKDALYDTVSLAYFITPSSSSYAFSAEHKIGNPSIPLHSDAVIRIKLDKQVPNEWQDKLFIVRNNNKGSTYRKAVWEEQWLSAKFGGFGSFQIIVDTESPEINDLGRSDTINLSASRRIIFTPTDNVGIKKFEARLNGQWLRFTNDKSKRWIYEFDERCPYGVHYLSVKVEDFAGNMIEKDWWFRRVPYSAPKKKSSYKRKN